MALGGGAKTKKISLLKMPYVMSVALETFINVLCTE